MHNDEKKLQVMYRGDWFYVEGIMDQTVQTTDEANRAMGSEYISLVTSKFPDMQFRGI